LLSNTKVRVKTELIRSNSSESVTVFFFEFEIETDSVRIRIWNQILLVTNTYRIWGEYSSVADKVFVIFLFDNNKQD
jgi:hypothetical protein